VTIGVEDSKIVIANQLPLAFCCDVGLACTNPFTGFEFIFSPGADITGLLSTLPIPENLQAA
jgi:hypothetical protein